MKPAWIKRGKHWRKCTVLETVGRMVRWRYPLRKAEKITRDAVRYDAPMAKDRPTTERQRRVLEVLRRNPMRLGALVKAGTTHYTVRALTSRGLVRVENGMVSLA